MNAARWAFVGVFVAFMHFVAGFLFRMAYLGVPEAIKGAGVPFDPVQSGLVLVGSCWATVWALRKRVVGNRW